MPLIIHTVRQKPSEKKLLDETGAYGINIDYDFEQEPDPIEQCENYLLIDLKVYAQLIVEKNLDLQNTAELFKFLIKENVSYRLIKKLEVKEILDTSNIDMLHVVAIPNGFDDIPDSTKSKERNIFLCDLAFHFKRHVDVVTDYYPYYGYSSVKDWIVFDLLELICGDGVKDGHILKTQNQQEKINRFNKYLKLLKNLFEVEADSNDLELFLHLFPKYFKEHHEEDTEKMLNYSMTNGNGLSFFVSKGPKSRPAFDRQFETLCAHNVEAIVSIGFSQHYVSCEKEILSHDFYQDGFSVFDGVTSKLVKTVGRISLFDMEYRDKKLELLLLSIEDDIISNYYEKSGKTLDRSKVKAPVFSDKELLLLLDFIRDKNNVMTHCQKGSNRSPLTAALLYWLHQIQQKNFDMEKFNLAEALSFLRAKVKNDSNNKQFVYHWWDNLFKVTLQRAIELIRKSNQNDFEDVLTKKTIALMRVIQPMLDKIKCQDSNLLDFIEEQILMIELLRQSGIGFFKLPFPNGFLDAIRNKDDLNPVAKKLAVYLSLANFKHKIICANSIAELHDIVKDAANNRFLQKLEELQPIFKEYSIEITSVFFTSPAKDKPVEKPYKTSAPIPIPRLN